MTRDLKTEKRIHFVSWMTWKLGAIINLLFIIAFIAVVIYLAKLPKSKQDVEALGAIALLSVFFIGYSGLLWWIGSALDRFKNWARWLTVIMRSYTAFILLLYSIGVVIALFKDFSKIQDQGVPGAIVVAVIFLLFLVGLVFNLWCIWAITNKRARKVFSREYRNRLSHGAFDQIQVTPHR